jgi:hypothetical protein
MVGAAAWSPAMHVPKEGPGPHRCSTYNHLSTEDATTRRP